MQLIHAKIYPCTSGATVIEDGYVTFEDGVITSVGKMTDPCRKDDQESINAKGMSLTPGFIDAHCHIGLCEDGMLFDDVNEETDPVAPQLRALDAINPLDCAFSEAVAAGVTTVAVAPGSANPIAGQICVMKTNGVRLDSMLIDPCCGIKLAFGENPKAVYGDKNQTPATRMATAALIREALYKAGRYAQDLARAEEDEELDPPDYDAKCEALLGLLDRSKRAHIHAHRADDIFTALRVAKEFGLECLIVHGTDGHLIAKELRGEGAPVMVGPVIGGRTKPELKNHTVGNAAALSRAGVPFCIITDHPEVPVQMLGLSAALCVHEGLDYYEGLRAITSYPAQLLGLEQKLGAIEPGKEADFLLFEGDPLSGFNRPKEVFIGGRRLDTENKGRKEQ